MIALYIYRFVYYYTIIIIIHTMTLAQHVQLLGFFHCMDQSVSQSRIQMSLKLFSDIKKRSVLWTGNRTPIPVDCAPAVDMIGWHVARLLGCGLEA